MIGQTILGRYQVLGSLGQGSMGRVYSARAVTGGSLVVVKQMRPEFATDPKYRDLFSREMQSMARFRHPYAVAFIEAAIDGPQGPVIVMEYVPGVTLQALLKNEPLLDAERVSRLLTQFAYALHAAHLSGIVHRDLKPANAMIVQPGAPLESVKVMDFGVAMLASVRPHIPIEKLTSDRGHALVGTPAYMSPEVIRGDLVDHRSDIYSLGVMVYEMLTGRLPFEIEDVDQLLEAHLSSPPLRFSEIGLEGLPRETEEVVRAALAKYPVERPNTPVEFAEQFAHSLALKLDAEPAGVAISPTASSAQYVIYHPPPADPNTFTQVYDAFMPEAIAVVKLRGFVGDRDGEVVESVPGLVRVLFDVPDAEPPKRGLLGWFGGKKDGPPPPDPIELALDLDRPDATHPNKLHITARFRPLNGQKLRDAVEWRDRCEKIATDLRAYLMAGG